MGLGPHAREKITLRVSWPEGAEAKLFPEEEGDEIGATFSSVLAAVARSVATGGRDGVAESLGVSWTIEPLLTPRELAVARRLGEVSRELSAIVEDGATRDADLAALATPVYALRHAVMAQAAARAYPELFRRLGEDLW